jgi:tetratricopeptide (TPR) repeat protein
MQMKELITVLLMVLFPYTLIGEEAGGPILICSLILIRMMSKVSKYKAYDKTYLVLLSGLFIYSFVIGLVSENPVRSVSGSFIYLLGPISYAAFNKLDEKKVVLNFVMLSSLLAVIFVLIQGVMMGDRIYGLVGYANTFALILLLAVFLTEILDDSYKKWIPLLNILIITGVFYTGDRVSITLLLVWGLFGFIKERKADRFFIVLCGAIEYMCFELLGTGSLLLSPLFTVITYYLYQFAIKVRRGYQLVIAIIPLASLFFFNTNTINRIKNISFTNGSLVERYISYHDAFRQSLDRITGYGVNSYEYMQYVTKSAFYESKYIHNVYVQHFFDLGLFGGLLFFILTIYIFVALYKSDHAKREIYIGVYLAIVIHGLMNFDSVFGIYWILLSFLISTSRWKLKPLKVRGWIEVSLMSVLFITSFCLFVYEGALEISSSLVKDEKWREAASMITIPYNLAIPDDRIYITSAAIRKQDYSRVQNFQNAQHVIDDLTKAELFNPIDPRTKWNIAYMYMEKKEYTKAEDYWDKVLAMQWQNQNIYVAYNRYLKKAYGEDKFILEKKRDWLENTYYKNRGRLNPLSQYLPNQLTEDYEKTIVQSN